MKFYLFDFDQTLFNSLSAEDLVKNNLYSHEKSVPLERNFILYERWNEQIINLFYKLRKNTKNRLFLVTARSDNEISRKTIKAFLKAKNLNFDAYYFGYDNNIGYCSKVDAMTEIVKDFGTPEEINFLDDNDYFLNGFIKYKEINKDLPFKLNIYKVVDGKINKKL
jgi:hypothetical protein